MGPWRESTVRKTAGQCQRVKQTLANLGVEFLERDISMAVAYKEELKKRLGLEEGKPAPVGEEREKGSPFNFSRPVLTYIFLLQVTFF